MDKPKPRELTKREIVDALRAIGITAGMKMMVHSSQKAVGRTEGGVVTIVEALMEAVTPEGTLMLPSFNHGRPWSKGGKRIYDPTRTPTWNGAIPDAFWRMPGVYRSLDPTHAIAAWGKDAKRYTQFHHRTLTMGPDSPLGLLGREGGWCLMMGVGYPPNTYHHVVEMTLGSPCIGQRTEAYPVRLPDGREVLGRTWGWRAGGCPITDRVRYAPFLAPYEKRGPLGQCEMILFPYDKAMEVISKLLKEGLGEFPPCSRCPVRPRVCEFTVESDWDAAGNCPKKDSVAWTY
ncbi:MAG: AAC(3) family N-acetyltransferase [Phycisphaerae bacterium]